MRHVTDDKLQVYVDTLGVQQFTPDLRPQRLTLCRAVLRGLASAMALPNPPQACWATLCSVTEKIYTLLPCHIQVCVCVCVHVFLVGLFAYVCACFIVCVCVCVRVHVYCVHWCYNNLK